VIADLWEELGTLDQLDQQAGMGSLDLRVILETPVLLEILEGKARLDSLDSKDLLDLLVCVRFFSHSSSIT